MNIAVTAYLVQQRSEWGVITGIARQYGVSRPFVYNTLFKMQESLLVTFGDNSYVGDAIDVEDALKHILSLRLEGGCSIQGISTCMKRFGFKNSSVGFISQYLAKVGSQLPSTFSNQENTVKLAVFASDEIFSKHTPILVTYFWDLMKDANSLSGYPGLLSLYFFHFSEGGDRNHFPKTHGQSL